MGFAVAFALAAVLAAAAPRDAMPADGVNALVAKYCVGCHTDADPAGGLSFQHFDASHAAPSLAAMMVSKLTGGADLATARAASSDPAAAAVVERMMKTGAMGASGLPRP